MDSPFFHDDMVASVMPILISTGSVCGRKSLLFFTFYLLSPAAPAHVTLFPFTRTLRATTAVRDTPDPCGGDCLRSIGDVRPSIRPRGGKRHPDCVPAVLHGRGADPHGPGPPERVREGLNLGGGG